MDFPVKWLKEMERILGDEYAAFRKALEEPAALALRLNALRDNAQTVRAEESIPWSPYGRYIKADDEARAGADVAHTAGVYYMQEASAQAPAQVLGARPGELILDLCAAPGGKSSQIAAMMGHRGALVSNEIDFSRAKALSGNLERLGVRNAAVICARPEQLREKWPDVFDAVLVDAPCSGEGMFRRDEAARGTWTPESPEGCAVRQKKILESAACMVRPGGRMVYSTCTFNETENEGVIRAFLSGHPDFSACEFELSGVGRSRAGMLRLWPHRLRGDGHFVASLRRSGDSPRRVPRRTGGIPVTISELLPGTWAGALEGFEFIESPGGFLDAAPSGMPDFEGLRVLRRGLRICSVQRTIKPDHALAMAFPPEAFSRQVSLNDAEARAYLRGETLPLSGENGWTHVSWRGYPLGFGKMVEGTLKNHLPKGLRRNR